MQVQSLGREDCPGGGHGNPLQYSCLENHMDKGAWQATVQRAAKSMTQLKWCSMHSHSIQLCSEQHCVRTTMMCSCFRYTSTWYSQSSTFKLQRDTEDTKRKSPIFSLLPPTFLPSKDPTFLIRSTLNYWVGQNAHSAFFCNISL